MDGLRIVGGIETERSAARVTWPVNRQGCAQLAIPHAGTILFSQGTGGAFELPGEDRKHTRE
ncbi:hypothetical protein C6Q22_15775 [Burkholderia multivorans]|nr:hypothetical protein WK22_25460 [Burkholderia multivorans]PRF84821.1 hypothetical protein C6Q22_15775 [Burkholderia multivorans]PRG62439.1 hypothetical protein C6T69_25660 [Burkholderia multivorans]